MFKKLLIPACLALAFTVFPQTVFAAGDAGAGHAGGQTFLFLAILLLAAKTGGIIEKFGLPGVLGEMAAGIGLSVLGFLGLSTIDAMSHDEVLLFIAEFGAVILLFQIGLESNVTELVKVGVNSVAVALIGAVLPFVLGSFVLAPLFFPESTTVTRLFIGATLVATSVGITVSVYQSLQETKIRAFKTFLGATLIDDVLGLLTLAVVSAIATEGNVSAQTVLTLTGKAVLFLGSAVLIGAKVAPYLSNLFSKIHTGTGMKVGLALSLALAYAYAATLVGLAPIVGAFAAGLILDAVVFKNFDLPEIVHDLKTLTGFHKKEKEKIDRLIYKHSKTHIEELVHTLGLIFSPIFFVSIGLQVDIESLLDPKVYLYAAIIAAVAIAGKVIAGVAAKGSWKEKLLVGVSMVPRGEVGLIFASVGKQLGALTNEEFSMVVLVILMTTFVAPPVVKKLVIALKDGEVDEVKVKGKLATAKVAAR